MKVHRRRVQSSTLSLNDPNKTIYFDNNQLFDPVILFNMFPYLPPIELLVLRENGGNKLVGVGY